MTTFVQVSILCALSGSGDSRILGAEKMLSRKNSPNLDSVLSYISNQLSSL